jgi:hypothetical protein
MAASLSPLSTATGIRVYRETDAGGGGTHDDIFGSGGASTMTLVKIDNTANAAEAEYFKAYNHLNPTIGTTVPDVIIPVAAGATVTFAVFRSSTPSMAFATGLSIAVTQASGGAVSPTSDVVIAAVGT